MPQNITNRGLEKHIGGDVSLFDSDGSSIMGQLDIDGTKGLNDPNRFIVNEGDYDDDHGVKLPPNGNLYEIHYLRPGRKIRLIINPQARAKHFRTYIYSQWVYQKI